ncbi:hypothetical protein BN961_02783 [Afipia felis]|uniref:Uncharacterized protein n=1 Tax=Afipia felis TaxID=1035 RepID=A0A090N817_AFIFE|nr:hypothetical protein BN961_02783 [Afipia felis]
MRAPLKDIERRHVAVEQIEIGKVLRQQRRIGKTHECVLRRDLGHRHRARGERCDIVAADVVGGDHRLPLADQHPQADIVTLGALRFLDAPVANFDTLRHAAHCHRIGGIRACFFRSLDEALRNIGERALIEQIGDG